jgi:hypothetical protein
MKWLRLYHEILDDPKVQRLEPALFKFWINFLCLANQGTPRGVVRKDAGEIAFALRISDDEAVTALAELERIGLIERVETGLKPHNWDERQRKSDDVTARVAAHRDAKKAHETLQATPTKHAGNVSSSRATEKELETEENGTPSESGTAAADAGADGETESPAVSDGEVYALVDAWANATDRKLKQVQGRERREAFDALKPLAGDIAATDVQACVRWFRSDPFWSEPGKLTVRKLAETLPQWIAQGRPVRVAPKARGTPPPSAPPPPRAPTLATDADQKAFADRFITQLRES